MHNDSDLPIIDWTQHSPIGASEPSAISKELLRLFAEQLPELQAAIVQAYKENNKDALQHSLHRLQGACAYCGLPRLRTSLAMAVSTLRQTGAVPASRFTAIQSDLASAEAELKKNGLL